MLRTFRGDHVTSERTVAAHHEAAHAVAARYLDQRFVSVTLFGGVRAAGAEAWVLQGLTDCQFTTPDAAVVVSLAGRAAERLILTPGYVADPDQEVSELIGTAAFAEANGGVVTDETYAVRTFDGDTARLLNAQRLANFVVRTMWHAIVLVARHIETAGTLSADELERLYQQA